MNTTQWYLLTNHNHDIAGFMRDFQAQRQCGRHAAGPECRPRTPAVGIAPVLALPAVLVRGLVTRLPQVFAPVPKAGTPQA